MVSEWCMSLYLNTDHVHIVLVRSSVHLTMASTVEAQTVEEAKGLSKTESCDRKPVIDLPAGILQLTEISTNFNVLCLAMVQHKLDTLTR